MWTGGLNAPNGYGSLGAKRGNSWGRVYAHRLSWELANGRPVPRGMEVMHACDNKRCVRPEHLVVGTRSRNIRDANLRGLMKSNKLTPQDVADIQAAARRFVQRIATRYGIGPDHAREVIGGRAWRSLHVDAPSN